MILLPETGCAATMSGVLPVGQVLEELDAATASLLNGLAGLTDTAARGPSLLPGWTRGHVLTHLARNAEGGVRLLGWARTGVASCEYVSLAARAAAIEEGAARPAAVLVADVRATASAFGQAAAAMPPGRWQHPVTWTTGQQTPADMVAKSRWAEVLIHHLDLDLGYRAGDWPATFVPTMLTLVVQALNGRALAPLSARLSATDSGRVLALGNETAASIKVSGTEAELLAWLLGRSAGTDLARDKPDELPSIPSVYLA